MALLIHYDFIAGGRGTLYTSQTYIYLLEYRDAVEGKGMIGNGAVLRDAVARGVVTILGYVSWEYRGRSGRVRRVLPYRVSRVVALYYGSGKGYAPFMLLVETCNGTNCESGVRNRVRS